MSGRRYRLCQRAEAGRHVVSAPPVTISPAAIEEPEPASRSGLFEMAAEGFIPGEDIAIAPILAHTRADPDGRAPSIEVTGTFVADEVIVFGRVSGTIHIVTRS